MTIADFWISAINRPFQPAPREGAAIRLHELDGLRGWAALSVVMFHIFWEIFGVTTPWLRNPITGFFLDGDLAVAIFFILSGEALSSAYFAGRGESAVVRLAVKRYTRLTIPIAATCVIIFLLSKFGLIYNKHAGVIVHRQDWLGSFLSIGATVRYYTKYALFLVYTKTNQNLSVDPFLWTMQFEMLGSALVFGVLFTFRYLKNPWLILLISVVFLQIRGGTSLLSCFLFGIAFSSGRMSGVFAAIQRKRLSNPVSWAAFILMAGFDGVAEWQGIDRARMAIFAVPIVLSIYCNRSLCKFFTSSLSRMLGAISFPLYLVQFPVFLSITSLCIVLLAKNDTISTRSALAIGIFSILACLFFAFLFMPIEFITAWIGKKIANVLLSDQK
jgi:peptidoglycan/LPS O-acetylase OafA/YrhL